MSQMTLDIQPTEPFLPTASSVRVGDDIEGYGGRGLPRRRHILGVHTEDGLTRLIYREHKGAEDVVDVMTLPADTPVDIAPPF